MCGILGVGSWTEMGIKAVFILFYFYSDCYIATVACLCLWIVCNTTQISSVAQSSVCVVHSCRLLSLQKHSDLLHRARVTGVSPELPAVLVSTLKAYEGEAQEHSQEHGQVISPQNQKKSIILTYFSLQLSTFYRMLN